MYSFTPTEMSRCTASLRCSLRGLRMSIYHGDGLQVRALKSLYRPVAPTDGISNTFELNLRLKVGLWPVPRCGTAYR